MSKSGASPLKGVAILGSTGSIGTSTLNVIERFCDRFRVVSLAAGSNVESISSQIARFRPQIVSVREEADAEEIRRRFPDLHVGAGIQGMVDVATHPKADVLVSAVVGAVGLVPTLRGIEAGKTIALANKETLVVAGEIVTRAVKDYGAVLLPVDSEHNAIHQCLAGRKDGCLRAVWLTASGGPFRTASLDEMRSARPEQALSHPTWRMGPKITIDSATLMNKGLEVIEACWLFDLRPSQVRVVVHPQSMIHSMVELTDGSVIAQLGVTDMRLPIQYALTYPERLETGLSPLDLSQPLALSFAPPDMERFPCLGLAYEAAEKGGTVPAVLNGANEEAVQAYLEERIGFLQIPDLLGKIMAVHQRREASDLETVLAADRWAREQARRLIALWAR